MLKIIARNIRKLESKVSTKNKLYAIVVDLKLDGSYVYQNMADDGTLIDNVFRDEAELNDLIAINPNVSVIINDL